MTERPCRCRQCLRDRGEGMVVNGRWLPAELTELTLCQVCGDKRCPRAEDHRNECAGSNESGHSGECERI